MRRWPRTRVLLAVLALVVVATTMVAVTAGLASSKAPRVIKGTPRADKINGSGGPDRIYGFSGADRIRAIAGADLIVGGPGRDSIDTGSGNDVVYSRDGLADTIRCGQGKDKVFGDPQDRVRKDCESVTRNRLVAAPPLPSVPIAVPTPKPKPSPTPSPAPVPGKTVVLTVKVNGEGSIKSSPAGIDCPSRCKASFPVNSKVVLTATPSAGKSIQGWGAACRGGTPTCALSLRANTWARAAFVTPGDGGGSGDGGGDPPPPPPPPPPSGGSGTVVLNGSRWVCNGPVNLTLVRVIRPPGDAIVLADGCTGYIGRIEVETWTADGVKIQNQSNPARDLVIGGGYVKCHAIEGDTHQDAVQAMAGSRITFRNIAFDCLGNSNFFVNRAAGGNTPTDIVCDGCTFAGKSSTTVRVNVSVRSGVRNSVACPGRNVREPFYFTGEAQSPVNSGNRSLAANDPLCQ